MPMPNIRPLALHFCYLKKCFLKDLRGVSLLEITEQLKIISEVVPNG